MSAFENVSNKDAEAGVWLVVDSNANEIASGNGLDSFIASFENNLVQFGAYRVHGVDEQENVSSVRPKVCRVNWVGPKVPMMKKMQALQGKEKIAQVWRGTAVEIPASSADDIDMEAIGKALLTCGGAHKPTHYDFGSGKIALDSLYAE